MNVFTKKFIDIFLIPMVPENKTLCTDSPACYLGDLHVIPVPTDNGVAEDIEELTPELQVSRGIREALTSNLTDDLRG